MPRLTCAVILIRLAAHPDASQFTVKLEPSGVSSGVSVSCTAEVPGDGAVYIVKDSREKAPMSPVVEPIVAVQSVKVTFPKSIRGGIWLLWKPVSSVGLSTTQSADS